jgi:2,4-diaminopentanoate dehydrogenase
VLHAARVDAESALDDICAILAPGKNVVSSAAEYHAYLGPGKNLEGGGVNAYQRISDACAAGKTSFFHAGIDPEFELTDHLSDRSDSCRKNL